MKYYISSFIILLFCFLNLQSCSSSDSNDGDENQPQAEDYIYFVSGKIDGQDFNFGLETGSTSLQYSLANGKSGVCTSENTDYGGVNYSSGVYDLTGGTGIDFTFVRFYLCSNTQSKVEAFNDSFPAKSYTMATSDYHLSDNDQSIAITYWSDINNDTYYSTFNGNSVNSSFEITKSTEANVYLLEQLIDAYQIIEGNFSGTFYNTDDPSDTVQITNGAFKLSVKLL